MSEHSARRCIYQCKDTNFKANHNTFTDGHWNSIVVFTNAKILILKLITTCRKKHLCLGGCIYQCKDTNFKANHNTCEPSLSAPIVVFTNAKILILKLITTTIASGGKIFCVVFTNAKILILKLITT